MPVSPLAFVARSAEGISTWFGNLKIQRKKTWFFSGGPLGDSNESLAIKNEFIDFVRMDFAPKKSRIDAVYPNLRLLLDSTAHQNWSKVVPSQTELKVEYFYNVNEKTG